MTDELNSQLSAFVDDALSDEESELLVRRLCRDSQLRATVARYALISDVLGGEDGGISAPADFSQRIMLRVEGQALPAVTPSSPVRRDKSLQRIGMAIAASVVVAAVALMVVPGNDPDLSPQTTVAATDATTTQPVLSLASTAPVTPPPTAIEYTVPRSVPSPAFVSAAQTAETRARLNNLLVQHLSNTTTRSGVTFRNVGYNTMQAESTR